MSHTLYFNVATLCVLRGKRAIKALKMAQSSLKTTYKQFILHTLINVGDRVERTAGGKSDFGVGETGIVIDIRDNGRNVDVELDESGDVSEGNAPHKLRVIDREDDEPSYRAPDTRATRRPRASLVRRMLHSVNVYMKTLLDEGTQALVKAGFIDGELLPTQEGEEALLHLLFIEKKEELVKQAKEKIAEQDKKKE